MLRLMPNVRQAAAFVAPAFSAATTAPSFSAARRRPAAAAPAAASCRKPRLHTLLDQRALELGESAADLEQEFPLRRSCIHLLCQRPKGDAPRLEIRHRGQQMRQRSTEPIQLPHHLAISGPNEGKRACQTGSVAAAATGPIFKQVTFIDAGSQKGVTPQVEHLPVCLS